MKKVICLSIFVPVHHLIKKQDLLNRMDGNGEEEPGENDQLSAFEGARDLPVVRQNEN